MRSKAIEQYKKGLKLSSAQRETLIGLLLGDACLESANGGRTYRMKIEQGAHHEAYVAHLYNVFQEWVRSKPRKRSKVASNGAQCETWTFQTLSHASFRFYGQQFYGEGGKQVPKLIHRWLTPRGLAYWFMDDGSIKSRESKGIVLNTQGFGKPGVERLVGVLRSKFALQAKTRKQKDGYQIYISGKSYEDFVKLVDPYVIETMRHKLPPARRTQLPKT